MGYNRAMSEKLMPTVSGLGYELIGVETESVKGGTLLRLFIDSDNGISIEDCERVSRQVGDLIEVEQLQRGEYTLEVSSPGMDRPLFSLEHYRRHIGESVRIRLNVLVNGRRKLIGEITGVDEDTIQILVDEEEFLVPFRSIEKSRVVPNWSEFSSDANET